MKNIVIAVVLALMICALFTGIGHAALVSAPTTTTIYKTLTWTNATTNCDGTTYIDKGGTNVYLTTTPTGAYTKIGSVLDPVLSSYTTAIVVPSNSVVLQCWMVRAVDIHGNESCTDSNQHCESFFGADTLPPAGDTDLK